MRSYEGFKLRGLVSPHFQRPLTAKLSVGPQKFSKCKDVLKVLYHRAKFGRARISPATRAAKNVEFFGDGLYKKASIR